MFNIVENFLRGRLAFLLLAVCVIGLGLALAQYIRTRNVVQPVRILVGAILLVVAGGLILWIAGTLSDDLSPNITQTVDPNERVSDYRWGQQTGAGGGNG